ncbi:MAG: HAD family hydrolase [Candidatus Methylomirabilia bacterium]
MHIGLDFDNTIVTYDRLFHRAARERGLIAAGVPQRKRDVRDAIRLLPGGEDAWTELQGVVYGRRMPEAEPAPGVEAFLAACRAAGARVSIISHKTEFPALGERVSLRDAARAWLAARGLVARHGIDPADVLFLGTIAEKLAAIAERACTHFVDDLVEVLGHPAFPPGVERILYASPGREVPAGVVAFDTWEGIRGHFFGVAR